VTHIGNDAFNWCLNLCTAALPDGLKHIGAGAFSNCSMQNMIIPDSVKEIGSYAFRGCQQLRNVVIPSGMTDIREGTFHGCSALAEITIPATVDQICIAVFRDCRNLTICTPAGSFAAGYARKYDIPVRTD
jgi:hypothetical protein